MKLQIKEVLLNYSVNGLLLACLLSGCVEQEESQPSSFPESETPATVIPSNQVTLMPHACPLPDSALSQHKDWIYKKDNLHNVGMHASFLIYYVEWDKRTKQIQCSYLAPSNKNGANSVHLMSVHSYPDPLATKKEGWAMAADGTVTCRPHHKDSGQFCQF